METRYFSASSMTINVVFLKIAQLCFLEVPPNVFSTAKLFQECGKLRLRAKGVCVAVKGPKRRPAVRPEPLKQKDGKSTWDWERVRRVWHDFFVLSPAGWIVEPIV